MAEIKKLNPESGWLEYALEPNAFIKPPVFRCRLRLVTKFDAMDPNPGVPPSEKDSERILNAALGLIVDWDLTEGGQPIPCTEEVKRGPDMDLFLKGLLSLQVEDGGEERPWLATSIMRAARDPEAFLKN